MVFVPGKVLPGQHHLDQGVMGQGPGWVEPLDQHLEGHVLVIVGGEAAPAHLGQEFAEAGISSQIDPQHQGVDEEPDQLVERGIATPGDRETHRHIGTRAERGQQHCQGGLNHHEAGRVVLTGESTHSLLELRRPVHVGLGAAQIGHQRIGPIGWQLQELGHPGQGILPVGQLPGDGAVAVVEIAEPFALPQRVIHVLHRQFGPARGAPCAPAGIRHAQITQQRGDRPAVGGDMVHHADQHVIIVGDPEKPCPQRYLGCQVKRVSRRLLDGLNQPARRPSGGLDDLPAHVGPLDGHDPLLGYAVRCGDQRAQALMACDHVGQRRTQRVDIEVPAQPQCHRHVVNR
ncbi:hypothetical protein GCM10023161_45100 [Mycobacterium paraffinicum]|uniref:Uncharacterized protein n=1 Tax=Mycobacterium paraffinicum TaxID=53378 RepID=A0ABP8F4L4_9MYCO